MQGFIRSIRWISGILNWVAGGALVGMMSITCADIFLRLFRRPIFGTYDIVEFLEVMVVGFAMAHTTIKKGHVAVQVVVTRFPPRVQKVIYIITHLLSLALFALLAWECVRYGNDLQASGEVSMTLELPFLPVLYGIAMSAALVCLVLSIDVLLVLTRGEDARYWIEA